MSQLTKVAKQLRRNTKYPGVTPSKLSLLSGVPKESVYKRVHDLIVLEGKTIYKNFRMVNGHRRMFYRLAA